ncbi:carboxypeptidase regulatory-like domain-containing protein [Candidatus Poribacteria bacterium]|nr:carboxypeptidase regulatory-like domain-containing protein [Candidatus Poribacteria bacterium]
MKKIIVFCGLILLLAFLLWWQLAELRRSDSNLASNPSQVEKTVDREAAREPSQGYKPPENPAHGETNPRKEPARYGVDVFGIVRDKAGSPIRGAEVKVFQGSDYHPGGEIITATLADGTYSLTGLHFPSNSPYQVVASAKGYAPASSGLFFISHPPKRIDLILTGGPPLSGRVMNESRRAIPGATVELLQGVWSGPMSRIDETETNADGAYAFKHVSPGDYWFYVSAKGYINQWRNIVIAPQGTQPAQHFLLEYAGKGYCSGVVLDENDQPLEGVKVKGYQSYVSALRAGFSRTCNSSADGSFLLEGFVTKGSDGGKVPIKLKATKEGYRESETTIFPDDKSVLIRLQKDLLGSISGRVVEAVGGDSSKPVTEFQVELFLLETSFISQHFQSTTGEFLISDISESSFYDLRISAPTLAPHFQKYLEVKSGEETSVGSIRLSRGAIITGKVRGKGKLEPLVGAKVYIDAGGAKKNLQILTGTSTDKTGFYRLEGVPPGSNYVLATHPDYATTVSPKIEVEGGEEYSDIDLVLANGGSIDGNITDDGIPLAGQMVSITPFSYPDPTGGKKILGPRISIQADENGYYHKDGLMPGPHLCFAYIPGRRADVTGEANTVSDFVEVVEGKTTRFDIDLCAGSGSVRGKVTSEAPIPPGTTGVSIQLRRNKAVGANTTTTVAHIISTSVGSSFSFHDVCPGEYTFETSLLYDIPGGVRSQGVSCMPDPPGALVVQAGKTTERDVVLTLGYDY